MEISYISFGRRTINVSVRARKGPKMFDVFSRVWENLIGRIGGPLSLRFLIQPLMATILAVRDGVKDAREGRPAYLWSLVTDAGHRRERLRNGWKSVGKIFVIALVLDTIYQIIVFRKFYPGEAMITAAILALIPYLLLRGPVNRLARRLRGRTDIATGRAA
jgi:hypothetical protein